MFKTRITELLKIRYPILVGAMHHITLADMAAAVANAGCICFIPAASFSDPERLRRELRKAKDQTDGPVGLNLSMLPNADTAALTADFVEVGIEEKVGAFETAGRPPDVVVGAIKGARIPLIHKVPQVKYARHAELAGVDAVTILGFEGGGFVGTAEVGSLVLVNKAVRTLSVPVIAGGGFVDGRGLVAALALGAEGVLMGSRFLASKEAPASSRHQTLDPGSRRERYDGTLPIPRDSNSVDKERSRTKDHADGSRGRNAPRDTLLRRRENGPERRHIRRPR